MDEEQQYSTIMKKKRLHTVLYVMENKKVTTASEEQFVVG